MISTEDSQQATDGRELAAIVAPLELASRKALTGPGGFICSRGFAENPNGFEAAAARALTKYQLGKSYDPLGLLVKMIRDGEHRIPDDPALSRRSFECPTPGCGRRFDTELERDRHYERCEAA